MRKIFVTETGQSLQKNQSQWLGLSMRRDAGLGYLRREKDRASRRKFSASLSKQVDLCGRNITEISKSYPKQVKSDLQDFRSVYALLCQESQNISSGNHSRLKLHLFFTKCF